MSLSNILSLHGQTHNCGIVPTDEKADVAIIVSASQGDLKGIK